MPVLSKRDAVWNPLSLIISLLCSLLLLAILAFVAWKLYQRHQQREDEKHRATLNASGLAQQGYGPNLGPVVIDVQPSTYPPQPQAGHPPLSAAKEKAASMAPTRGRTLASRREEHSRQPSGDRTGRTERNKSSKTSSRW